MRVLLVDDQESSLLALEALLDGLGLSLAKARSGDEALRLLLAGDFALILMDVQMPGMDGFEIARMIRQRDRSSRTPIIFLTACDPNDEQVSKGYSLGAVDFLFKPIVPEILRAKVMVFVELQQKTDELLRQGELLRENERREHGRELAEQRRLWEVERLREEAAQEKRIAEELAGIIAQRERAEAALLVSEERFRALIEYSTDAIVLLDAKGTVTYASPSLFRVLGYTPSQFVGQIGFEFVYPPDLDMVLSRFAALLERPNQVFTVQTRAKHQDGSWRWMEVLGTNLLENPAVQSIVANFRDITDRKQAEQERTELLAREQAARAEAETANRAKDEFLAVLSHELRTPLTPVLLSVSALLDDPHISPEMRPSLELTRRNVELEARLIDDLLDVTHIVRGKLPLQFEVLDAHKLIQHTVEMFEAEIKASQIELTVELKADKSFVRADPARLQQVLWNLTSNAIKFTPSAGSITVRSESLPDESSDAGRLRIVVSDTGVGIDPAALPRVFDAFTQEASSRRSRRFGGLGLGLAISQSVIQAHGGELRAASQGRNRGSTFTIEMSCVPAPSALETSRPERREAMPARQTLTILVVEDDAPTLRVLTRLLRSLGYQILSAENCAKALELADTHALDLVISDIGLPDGSGLELMREIRSRKSVKGIALSGFGMEDDIQRSRDAGFIEHLTKPIDLQRLEATILRVGSY